MKLGQAIARSSYTSTKTRRMVWKKEKQEG